MLKVTVRALFGGDSFTEDVQASITVKELTAYAASKLVNPPEGSGEDVVFRLMCNVRSSFSIAGIASVGFARNLRVTAAHRACASSELILPATPTVNTPPIYLCLCRGSSCRIVLSSAVFRRSSERLSW